MKKLTLGAQKLLWFRRPFKIDVEDAKNHWQVVGKTGSGKSNFLANLYLSFLDNGLPVSLIDPHGDLAELVLRVLVDRGSYNDQSLFDRLIYLDLPSAARSNRILPFNVLRQGFSPHTIGANILEALQRAYPELAKGAPAFGNIVKYGIKILISNGMPITSLQNFLIDAAFRRSLYAREQDPDVVSYFASFFDRMTERQRIDEIDSALRRLGDLLYNPFVKYSLSSTTSVLDFRDIFESGKSVIIDLSLVDGSARRLLGCLFAVQAEMSALARSDVPQGQRLRSHHWIMDEFHQFSYQSGKSMTTLLSEARKFNIHLVLCNQSWGQLGADLCDAVQNVRVAMMFEQGRPDAEYSAPILSRFEPMAVKHEVTDEQAATRTHPTFSPVIEQREGIIDEIRDLSPGQGLLHLSIPQRHNGPFRWLSHPHQRKVIKLNTPLLRSPSVDPAMLDSVKKTYLDKYFQPQAAVEALVNLRRRPVLSVPPRSARRR